MRYCVCEWMCLCIYSFDAFMSVSYEKMGRTRKHCPVPGCRAKRLVKLSNHLYQVHQLDGISRRRWLARAVAAESEEVHLLKRLVVLLTEKK